MNKNKTLTPMAIIYVDGIRLAPVLEGSLRSLRVTDPLNRIGECVIVFSCPDPDKIDIKTFAIMPQSTQKIRLEFHIFLLIKHLE